MGAGWQAVTGRGMVHEDWQGWVSCKWGERVCAECLACHSSPASLQMVPMVHWRLTWSLNWFLFFALPCLALIGLVSHSCFPCLASLSRPLEISSFPFLCLVTYCLPSSCLLSLSCLLWPFLVLPRLVFFHFLYCLLFLSFSPNSVKQSSNFAHLGICR